MTKKKIKYERAGNDSIFLFVIIPVHGENVAAGSRKNDRRALPVWPAHRDEPNLKCTDDDECVLLIPHNGGFFLISI